MLNKRQTARNALSAMLQVAISACLLLFLYRYLLRTIGAERLGVWSIVMAASTLARISDMGFAGGMTRFVAKYSALADSDAVQEIIETGAISLLFILACVGLLAVPVLNLAFPYFLSGPRIVDALQLVPYSLASFVVLTTAGVFLSSLDGQLRSDLKNLVLISGSILNALLTFLFVGAYGFVGLGFALLGQSFFVLFVGWLLLKKVAELKILIPYRWSLARFKEMLAYNANLQVSTFAGLLAEPAAKILLGRFGMLSEVGYFEMANKLIAQFRALVVNVNQVLVPVIAQLHEINREGVKRLFQTTYTMLLVVSSVFFAGLSVSLPLICELWLGAANPFFLLTGYAMSGAMLVNTLSGPAFFSNLGTGSAGLNARAQVLIGAVNIGASLVLGSAFGGVGVVVAYGLAITVGSAYLIHGFLAKDGMGISTLLPSSTKGFLAACIGVVVGMAILNEWLTFQTFWLRVAATAIALFMICVAAATTGLHTVARKLLQSEVSHV